MRGFKTSVFVAGLATASLSQAAAQSSDCASTLDAKKSSGEELLACLIEMQETIRQLGTRLTTAEGRIVSKGDIETIVTDGTADLVSSGDLAVATTALPSEERVVALIDENNVQNGNLTTAGVRALVAEALFPYQAFKDMKGVVIAFDRSEDRGGGVAGGACPVGWSLFRDAGGRVIIGAGAHENNDRNGRRLNAYRAFSDDPDDATGGAETHTLTVEEMPKHSHEMKGLYTREAQGKSTNRVNYSNSQSAGWRTSEEGSGRAHNNMPPYIALYFCKKEG